MPAFVVFVVVTIVYRHNRRRCFRRPCLPCSPSFLVVVLTFRVFVVVTVVAVAIMDAGFGMLRTRLVFVVCTRVVLVLIVVYVLVVMLVVLVLFPLFLIGGHVFFVSLAFLVFARTVSRSTVSVSVCLLYTSPSPRDQRGSRMPSSA